MVMKVKKLRILRPEAFGQMSSTLMAAQTSKIEISLDLHKNNWGKILFQPFPSKRALRHFK
jgi:hypothetical protein